MERPPDSYKTTHNVTLAKRDTWFGGQVSRLQVAELIATAASNPDLAENKVSGLGKLLPEASVLSNFREMTEGYLQQLWKGMLELLRPTDKRKEHASPFLKVRELVS